MRRVLLLLMLVLPFIAAGQEETGFAEVLESARTWAEENLDEDFLRALPDIDEAQTREFLKQLNNSLLGEYVVDLAALKETSRKFIPLLESYEETAPYASWLKTRIDYFEVADQYRAKAPKPGDGGKIPNPPPVIERELWDAKVQKRPWPQNAKKYVDQLKAIFKAEKIPPELVWIAEVESSFDPKAVSPAGAAGMFQLMPATAKSYGLRRWPADQRFSTEASARAAAKHLRYLHSRYKDWRLALAAYNAGEGRVDRVIAGRKKVSFDVISTRLPAETQMYVPKMEAILLKREGLRLSQLGRSAG